MAWHPWPAGKLLSVLDNANIPHPPQLQVADSTKGAEATLLQPAMVLLLILAGSITSNPDPNTYIWPARNAHLTHNVPYSETDINSGSTSNIQISHPRNSHPSKFNKKNIHSFQPIHALRLNIYGLVTYRLQHILHSIITWDFIATDPSWLSSQIQDIRHAHIDQTEELSSRMMTHLPYCLSDLMTITSPDVMLCSHTIHWKTIQGLPSTHLPIIITHHKNHKHPKENLY